MDYHFREIEKKWQARWAKEKPFKAENTPIAIGAVKPKYFVLDMFPYPSGAGLHVGHPLGYIASDIMARYKRHKGFNVLHPMGYDSFGLPAEQYAIQTGQHPAITTEQNINRYREQLDKIGFSFDWDREVRTSDPNYYKWTQWIFIQLFNSWYNKKSDKAESLDTLISEFEKNGNANINACCDEETKLFSADEWKKFSEKEKSDALMHYRIAYLGEAYVNWCPALGTVLANDEVKDGVSERGGHLVERKLMKQWSMRITAYAQRLLDGLNAIDWPESLKESQRNWIGKSVGTSLSFKIQNHLSPTLSKGKGAEASSVKEPGYHTTDGQIWNLLQDKALRMRGNPTAAEAALWHLLKGNKLEAHFRRQQIIGRFIVDFVCLSKKLVIEVDGDIHDYQKEEDAERTLQLVESGYKVIRFRNEEVIADTDSVIKKILTQLDEQCKVLPIGEDLGGVVTISVFTTRPDTIFGVSFVTLAPEHELVDKITTPEQKSAVDDYVTKAKNRSERERQADVNTVSGVFTGAYVEHPFTGKDIPVWIGDYVLAGYGTGAVMAVPAHDERDFKFAGHFGLEKPQVIVPTVEHSFETNSWDEKEGKLINSDFLNGLEVKAAIKKAIEEIEKQGLGKGKTNFRLRDAVFGRQRYWGEPIPIYYKDGIPFALAENELPLILPEVDKFLPTEDGEPPLARAKNWRYRPQGEDLGGAAYPLETTTMPGWAGSSWYFLRYMDANNDKAFADKKLTDYWKNVDLYIGGSEHATGHLLYVRFWTKFLKDFGYISVDEPAEKLINQGMIQGRSNFVYRLVLSFDPEKHVEVVNYFRDKPIFVSKSFANYTQPIDDPNFRFLQNEIIKIKEASKKVIGEHDNKIEYMYGTIPLNVDVNIVSNDILDKEAFKKWKPELKNAIFINEENGNYLCGSEVEKMSKSKWNVVSPDDICERYGADTLRLYEMFLGPLEQSKPWNTNGITGVSGFLKKLWKLFFMGSTAGGVSTALNVTEVEPTKAELKTLHKTIKKITEDIDRFSFNTSVSNFMICVNELTDQKCNKRAILEPLLILVSPYAPHIAEELWENIGHKGGISAVPFPEFNETYLVEDNFNYPVSFNGKMRFNIELPATLTAPEIEKEIMSREEVQKYLNGAAPKKVIVVPKKIVNIVV